MSAELAVAETITVSSDRPPWRARPAATASNTCRVRSVGARTSLEWSRTSSFATWKPNSSTRRSSAARAPVAIRPPRFASRLRRITPRSASERLRRGVAVVAEPPPDVGELPAVALGRHHLDDLVPVADALALVSRDRLLELGRDADERAARRDRDRELADVGLIPGERRLAGALERREDRLEADLGVAVQVAADPASEGEGRRGAGREAPVLAQEALAGVEQALLEEPEAVPDLVAHAGTVVPDLVRLPEDRDLPRELLLELGPLGAGQLRVVVAGEDLRDPHVRPQERPPGRLGGMRGEDELQRDAGEPVSQLVPGNRREALERLFERLAGRPGLLRGHRGAA